MGHTINAFCIKFQTVDSQICSILIFRKKYETNFSTTFCMIFQEKFFLCYILLTDQTIVWLPPLPEIMDNICIAIISFPVDDVINVEVHLYFLIRPFSCMIKRRWNKKLFLINFKGLPVARDFYRPGSGPLSSQKKQN